MSTEFPLKDSNGSLVITERRRLTDRRLENTSLADRLLMFSGLVQVDPDNNSVLDGDRRIAHSCGVTLDSGAWQGARWPFYYRSYS